MSPFASYQTVTPIGSCRITQPLKLGQDPYRYILNRSGVYGYCHSSAEAVQMANVLLGNLTIPENVWPLLSKSERSGESHTLSDLYVIELCSAKSITLDGWSVQLNYLNRQFPEVFDDQSQARAFWALVDTGDKELLSSFLRRIGASDVEKLSRIKRVFTSKRDLRCDMARLLDLLPSIVFVTHVNARQSNGDVVLSRSNFIQDVRDCAEELGARFYDPTEAMQFVGQPNAMATDDEGLAHFETGFDEVIAHDLARVIYPSAELKNPAVEIDQNQSNGIFALAKRRHTAGAEHAVAKFFEEAPKTASSAACQLVYKDPRQLSFFPNLAEYLSDFEKDRLWARHGIGALISRLDRTDLQAVELIEDIAEDGAFSRLDQLLTEHGVSANCVHRALDGYVSAQFGSHEEALRSAKVVLKHVPKNPAARDQLKQVRSWIAAQDIAKVSRRELTEIARLNEHLPMPINATNLAIARRAFQDGDYAMALKLGRQVERATPENVTLLVMLMRAANRSHSEESHKFARIVLGKTDQKSSFAQEAQRILDAAEVSA